MDRNAFQNMARNNPADALMYLFDQCEAAELEYASLHAEDTTLQGEIDALQAADAAAAAPAAPAA